MGPRNTWDLGLVVKVDGGGMEQGETATGSKGSIPTVNGDIIHQVHVCSLCKHGRICIFL